MSRLTKKIKGANNYCEFELKEVLYKDLFDLKSNKEIEDYVNCDLTLAIDKLGKLEDLEEQLGCPLEVIFKALTNGVWIEEQNFIDYTSRRPSKMMKGYIATLHIENKDFNKSYFNLTVGIKLCFNWRDDLRLYDEKYISNYKSHELYKRTFAVNSIDTNWDKNQKPFTINSYKENWWLKEDKSE